MLEFISLIKSYIHVSLLFKWISHYLKRHLPFRAWNGLSSPRCIPLIERYTSVRILVYRRVASYRYQRMSLHVATHHLHSTRTSALIATLVNNFNALSLQNTRLETRPLDKTKESISTQVFPMRAVIAAGASTRKYCHQPMSLGMMKLEKVVRAITTTAVRS